MSIRVKERPLNFAELEVLERLLAVDFPEADRLRTQLPHTRVVGRCDCGCATVDLKVERSAPTLASETLRSPIPSEATVLDDEGEPLGGVIVFLKEGYLSMLEVYMFGNEPIRQWPPAERLRLEVRGA